MYGVCAGYRALELLWSEEAAQSHVNMEAVPGGVSPRSLGWDSEVTEGPGSLGLSFIERVPRSSRVIWPLCSFAEFRKMTANNLFMLPSKLFLGRPRCVTIYSDRDPGLELFNIPLHQRELPPNFFYRHCSLTTESLRLLCITPVFAPLQWLCYQPFQALRLASTVPSPQFFK